MTAYYMEAVIIGIITAVLGVNEAGVGRARILVTVLPDGAAMPIR